MSTENSPILQSSTMKRTLIFHFLGIPAAYFLTAYFSSLYPGLFYFIFISLFFQLLCGIAVSVFLKDILEKPIIYWCAHWTSLLVLAVVSALNISAIVISWKFPSLFDRRLIFIDRNMLPLFIGLVVATSASAVSLERFLDRRGFIQKIRHSAFFHFVQSNLAGIFVALLFFLTYFIFTQSLNFPDYNILDQFFDTDVSQWIARLTLRPMDEMPAIRGVHPIIMFILRPPMWLISILLSGDKLQAVYILSALAGSLCVFLIWLIVKRYTGNTAFSLITTSILGASASHLLLSSMLETYIFSALALILFCFLMQSERTSINITIPLGIVIFGITITNLAQACILYFLKLPRLKVMIQFTLAVITIVLLLNALQVQLFPKARPLYNPTSLLFEQRYQNDLSETSWRRTGRVNLMSRAILLYGVVAPSPFILMEELGTNVPNLRTFQISGNAFHVAGYKGLPDITAKLWLAIIGLASTLFTIAFFKSPNDMNFHISLILCILFNFVLHIIYGDDPMLYSPNWVYALILFVSLSLGRWADSKWLQLGLIVFLGMMIYTNLNLIHQIMEISLPYYGN